LYPAALELTMNAENLSKKMDMQDVANSYWEQFNALLGEGRYAEAADAEAEAKRIEAEIASP